MSKNDFQQQLKPWEFEFYGNNSRDTFLRSSKGVNKKTKIAYILLEQFISSGIITKSNRTLLNLVAGLTEDDFAPHVLAEAGCTERMLQQAFEDFEAEGLITRVFEDETKRNRQRIDLNLSKWKEFFGITKYDKEYKNAPKRSFKRRMINQFPGNYTKNIDKMIKEAIRNKQLDLVERLRARKENFVKFAKWNQKKYNNYQVITSVNSDRYEIVKPLVLLAERLGAYIDYSSLSALATLPGNDTEDDYPGETNN